MTMTLFDSNDVGPEGEELLHGRSSAVLHRGVISSEAADRAMAALTAEVDWEQPTIRMYGKTIPQPRLVAWFGDRGLTYSYSGTTMHPHDWTPTLESLKTSSEVVAGAAFNSGLVNLYRDGADSVAWHADDEPELGTEPIIASLSLGAERRFHLKHRESGETVRVDLPAGSVVVMSGRCQSDWVHQISKTKRPVEPRINLTFRRILT